MLNGNLPVNKEINYYPALTGLRCVAAYLVFFHHFNLFPPGSLLNAFSKELNIGVSIFFVLSGFLIADRYQSNFSLSRSYLKVYFLNRIARIYPLYFILTLLTFILAPYAYDKLNWQPYFTFEIFIYNITFLRGFFDSILFTGIMQGWSLTVEESFYLIGAPILFLARFKFKLLFFLGFFLFVGIVLVQISKINATDFVSSYYFMFNYTFFGRIFEFAIGIFLSIAIQKNENHFVKWSTLIGFIGLFLSIIALSFYPDTYMEINIFRLSISNFTLPIFVALMLNGLIKEKTWVSKLLSTKTALVLGKSSYAFYLIHLGVLQILISNYLTLFSSTIATILLFAMLIITSIILYYTVEEPLNKKIRTLY